MQPVRISPAYVGECPFCSRDFVFFESAKVGETVFCSHCHKSSEIGEIKMADDLICHHTGKMCDIVW